MICPFLPSSLHTHCVQCVGFRPALTLCCSHSWPGYNTHLHVLSDIDLQEELLGLEDINWEEDWEEIEELCGADSLCCVPQAQPFANWGISVFEVWCEERGVMESLLNMSNSDLNRYISCFIHEAVKKDGNSLGLLYQLVVSIQRNMAAPKYLFLIPLLLCMTLYVNLWMLA